MIVNRSWADEYLKMYAAESIANALQFDPIGYPSPLCIELFIHIWCRPTVQNVLQSISNLLILLWTHVATRAHFDCISKRSNAPLWCYWPVEFQHLLYDHIHTPATRLLSSCVQTVRFTTYLYMHSTRVYSCFACPQTYGWTCLSL